MNTFDLCKFISICAISLCATDGAAQSCSVELRKSGDELRKGYSGECSNGLANGRGTYSYLSKEDGVVYEVDGSFSNGKLNGLARMHGSDKAQFEGNFVENKLDGKARTVGINGEWALGTWKADRPWDLTIVRFQGGKKMAAHFARGKQIALCIADQDNNTCTPQLKSLMATGTPPDNIEFTPPSALETSSLKGLLQALVGKPKSTDSTQTPQGSQNEQGSPTPTERHTPTQQGDQRVVQEKLRSQEAEIERLKAELANKSKRQARADGITEPARPAGRSNEIGGVLSGATLDRSTAANALRSNEWFPRTTYSGQLMAIDIGPYINIGAAFVVAKNLGYMKGFEASWLCSRRIGLISAREAKGGLPDESWYDIKLTEKGRQQAHMLGTSSTSKNPRMMPKMYTEVAADIVGIKMQSASSAEVLFKTRNTEPTEFTRCVFEDPFAHDSNDPLKAIFSKYDDGWRIEQVFGLNKMREWVKIKPAEFSYD